MTLTDATTATTGHRSGLRLRVDRVSLGYGPGEPVVRNLSLDVPPGEVLVVVGASGCGKSTLLRALAGLLPVAAGTVAADGTTITGPSPDRALVFQDDALLSWRTARRNVELPLSIRRVTGADRRRRAEGWLARVGLAGQEHRLPAQLSGGMRQRVQLARTLAGGPRAILMDEPFGALDAQTRAAMQRLLVDVLRSTPATVVFVTHDVDEALFIGDRVAVLGPGGVQTLVDVPQPRDPATRGTPVVRAARGTILAALGADDRSHPC
ncbi:MAG TPA: ABC transporter ATP-binding protein [Pilimelia sp.]|nr:ABC transporter ATP-binding protein [Pilimelia sp.]